MNAARIRALEGADVEIAAADVAALNAAIRGTLLRPGEAGYDASRTIWNGMIDRRPGLIARCIGVADVVACVKFARERGLLVCIRGGGHKSS